MSAYFFVQGLKTFIYRVFRTVARDYGRHGGKILVVGLLFLPLDSQAVDTNIQVPAKPEWLGRSGLTSSTGEASLSWQVAAGKAADFFRLSESFEGETRVSYVESRSLKIHRAEPGVYGFTLEGCVREPGGLPLCGPRSRLHKVVVSDEIYQPYIQERPAGESTKPLVGMTEGGPTVLRPGRWFNPNKSGMGWSMYWSNRLALSENPSNTFDLQIIWYTYEAKKIVAYCDGPNDQCPPLVKEYYDYRPVVASMDLIQQDSDGSYVGAVKILRSGVEQNVGSAVLNFGLVNTEATIEWSVNFKKQSLSGIDQITLETGGDGVSVDDASRFAGLWGSTSESVYLTADIGTLSQTLEAVFYDDNGDPAWIMAHRNEEGSPPAASKTDLCFYYTPGGFPPNEDHPVLIISPHTSCAPDDAHETNRNGHRSFIAPETASFWVNFDLPPGEVHDNKVAGGQLRLGTATKPVNLAKSTNLHRIWFSGSNSCEVSSVSPICHSNLTWFTNSDYPSASAWAFNRSTNQRTLVEASNPVREQRSVSLDSAGEYVFELRQGSTQSSALLAESAVFTVRFVDDVPVAPLGLAASWVNESTLDYRLDWNHINSASVSYYELHETAPTGFEVVFTISPGESKFKLLGKPSGPWGNYAYKVRACSSSGSCSTWTQSVVWLVQEPGTPGSGPVQQPWSENETGNLNLDLPYQFALGYYFKPNVGGHVTQLGGYFNGVKQVKLFHRASGNLLASTTISSNYNWAYVDIPAVAMTAGEEYTVAAYLQGDGASARGGLSFPATFGDITIMGSAYAATSSNPDAIPSEEISFITMYGQVDIGFVSGELTDDHPPQVVHIPDQQDDEGAQVSLQVDASDPDGSIEAYVANGLPAGLGIDQSGLISGTIADGAAISSPYQVTVTVTDNDGLSAQRNFSWIVDAPPGTEQSIVFTDSFENGSWNGLWTEDSQNDWFWSGQRATEGNWSAEVDGYANDAALTSIPIDLAGATEATVEFDWFIESSLDLGEYLAFDISTDNGSSWDEKSRLSANIDQENTWHHETVELAGLTSLRLRFRAKISYYKEDANVDNILVKVSAPSPNTPPLINSPGNQTTVTGSTIQALQIDVSDAENDPVNCTISGLPAGLAETAECLVGGTVSAPAGNYGVTIAADDGKDSATPVQFNWAITQSGPVADPEIPPAPAGMPDMSPSVSSSQVGATAGSFAVNEAGHATYSIPLLTAAGSGGLSPDISLNYSSNGRNGVIGVGWSLGGLSAIGRCPQTLEQDGVDAIQSVTLTSDDRFCLDGQRLMLVSGAYGMAGSTYRTEIDGISKIVANNTAGSGPESFTVWRKEGTTIEYGKSLDSRIEARVSDDETVLSWAQSRIMDPSGNYIIFQYQELGSTLGEPVEVLLQRVSYTGNTRAGTAPYAELNFIYDDSRPDTLVTYFAGAGQVLSKRLNRIDSKARLEPGGVMQSLRSYVLSYSSDPQGRSLLSSLKECRDSSQVYCFEPTEFEWHLRSDAISTVESGSFELPGILFGLTLGEMTGDGRPDLLYTEKVANNYRLKTAVSQANGGFSSTSVGVSLPKTDLKEPVKPATIDLNADGFQDVIYAHDTGSGPGWYMMLANSQSSGFTWLAPAATGSPSLLKIMDFDGDGLPDLVYGFKSDSGPGQKLVWQKNLFVPGGTVGFAPHQIITAETADLFPDDVPDSNPAQTNHWFINDEHPSFAIEANPVRSQVFDYNGDGAVDLLVRVSRQYCQGDCGFEPPGSVLSNSEEDSLFLENLWSDPFEEIPEFSNLAQNNNVATVSYWLIYESDRQENFVPREVIARDVNCTLPEVCNEFANLPIIQDPRPVDVNLDGLADLVFRNQEGGWAFRLNSGREFFSSININGVLPGGLGYAAQLHDVNGDSYPDLAYPENENDPNSFWAVHFNQAGSAFGPANLIAAPAGNSADKDFGVFTDFNADGKLDYLFVNMSSTGQVYDTELRLGENSLAPGSTAATASSVLATITDGFGATTAIEYLPLTDARVYSRMHDASNAQWGRGSVVYDLVAPMFVVSKVESSAPNYANSDAMNRIEYHYLGAKIQAGGRGSLGFGEVISYDTRAGIRSNMRYRQDFPFIGMLADTTQAKVSEGQKFDAVSSTASSTPVSWPLVSATTEPDPTPNGSLINYSVNQWSVRETVVGRGTWFPFVINSLERTETLAGNLGRKVFTSNTYNNVYGDLDSSVVRTYGNDSPVAELTLTTNNSYSHNFVLWQLGRLAGQTVTFARPGNGLLTRSSSFDYEAETGNLNLEIIEPGDSELQVATSYQLDTFGNRIATTVEGIGMQPRNTSQTYDSLGRYVMEKRNNYSQTDEQVLLRDVFGNILNSRNISDVLTLTATDYMGRNFISWSETGAWEKSQMYAGVGSICPAGGNTAYHTLLTGGGQPRQYRCFDKLGREIRTAKQGFNGSYILVDTAFDEFGRVARVSEPYFQHATVFWNETAYDALGRMVAVVAADGSDLEYEYDEFAIACGQPVGPRQILTTNGLGQQQLEIRNALGEPVTIFDAACGAVNYEHDSIGNLIKLVGVDGVVTKITYDRAGRKLTLDDDDKGYWQYRYNALGELTRQLDSKSQAIDFSYDHSGRVTNRHERVGVDSLSDNSYSTTHSETTTWLNTTAGSVDGKGQVSSIVYQVGKSGTIIHQQNYSYDEFGRQSTRTIALEDVVTNELTTYDQYSRIFQQFDSSGEDHGIRYHYNSYGYLEKLQEAREGVEGIVYQQVLGQDERGNVTAMKLGNGVEAFADFSAQTGRLRTLEAYDRNASELQRVDYTFDVLGNLVSRNDTSKSQNLNESFNYDELNRLESVLLATNGSVAQETLALQYDPSGNISYKSDVGHYSYGQNGAGAHALTAAGGTNYGYDANGNQISSSNGRNIDYSVFDKPTLIQKGANFTEFEYGIGNQRIKRVDSNSIDSSKTILYFGTVERIEPQGESAFYRRMIGGIALVDYFPGSGTSMTSYLLKDHLGSIHTVVDESGTAAGAVSMHFSAFGERQNTTWNGPLSDAGKQLHNMITTRGFTGHEHADGMNVVHMNGRLYDPRLGRFLQADPFVQAPTNSQSLNRYSYVLNNPLSYTDPTGYFSFSRFIKKWGRVIVAAVATYFTWGATSGWAATFAWGSTMGTTATLTTVGSAFAGAFSGAVGGAILAGTLKGAFQGATVGALTAGLASYYGNAYSVKRVAAESVSGGVSAEIYGQDFRDGLKLAFAVSVLNYSNYRMRTAERNLSNEHPLGRNTNGESAGFYGDGTKMAGAREQFDSFGNRLSCVSPAGGCQGAPVGPFDQRSNFFGTDYSPGGMKDFLNESFAGPHDWFRNNVSRSYIRTPSGTYDIVGNMKNLSGVQLQLDRFANAALIPLAAPFAVAGMLTTQTSMYSLTMQYLYNE